MSSGGATRVSAECFADRGRVPASRSEEGGSVATTYLEEGGPAAALGRLCIWLGGVGHVDCLYVQGG